MTAFWILGLKLRTKHKTFTDIQRHMPDIYCLETNKYILRISFRSRNRSTSFACYLWIYQWQKERKKGRNTKDFKDLISAIDILSSSHTRVFLPFVHAVFWYVSGVLLLVLTLQRGVTSTARHSVNITCRGVTSPARHAARSHSFVYISTS